MPQRPDVVCRTEFAVDRPGSSAHDSSRETDVGPRIFRSLIDGIRLRQRIRSFGLRLRIRRLAVELALKLVTIDEPVVRDFPDVAIHLRDFIGS